MVLSNLHAICNTAFLYIETSQVEPFLILLFCAFPGWKTKEEIPKLVSDYMAKKFNIDPLITHTLTLSEVNEAVQLMRSGQW